MTVRRELLAALAAAGTAATLHRADPRVLRRTAASGRPVTLAAGPAAAAGLLAARIGVRDGVGAAQAGVVAVTVAAVAGLVDDLGEEGRDLGDEGRDLGERARPTAPPGAATTPPRAATGPAGPVTGARDRGLGGHLRALRAGRVTTGALKVVLIGAGAVAAAGILAAGRPGPEGARRAGVRLAADSVLVAGTANLLNLFDTRPGRAGKVGVLAVAVLLAGTPRTGWTSVAAGVPGVLAATLPGDLRGRWMLGDGGANALGAALGVSAAAVAGPRLRAGWLVTVLALTAASERVSFTAVIARHRPLAALDRLGQR